MPRAIIDCMGHRPLFVFGCEALVICPVPIPGPFSLCLRALSVYACGLLVYAYGPLSFMPAGPCLLCLRALLFVIDLHCYNVALLSRIIA